MSASTQHSALNLGRLPPELVEEIVLHVGVKACAALRDLRALHRVLAAYVHAGNYTNDCEKAMFKALVDCRWSHGVQAMIDAGIRQPFGRAEELDWSGIVLPISSIQMVYGWGIADGSFAARDLLSILTYNYVNAGADSTDLLQWGAKQVLDFVDMLSSQYIKRDCSLEQLRALHQRIGVCLHERDFAKTLLPLAALHGRLDLVQALDGVIPEVMQERSATLRHAATGGHLQVVQYAHSRLQSALSRQIVDVAMESGHEGVARWLYERHPQAVNWRAALGLARNGHVELLQLLQDNGHIPHVDLHAWWRNEWSESAGVVAAAAEDARVLQVLRQIDPAFSVLDAFIRNASRAFLPTLQHVIRNESPTPNPQVFCAAASAGRTDIVDWILADYPQWTSAEAIMCAAGAGHQELAQRLSDHFGVPLKDRILQIHHLQALVESGHLQKLEWIKKHCQLSWNERLLLSGIWSRNLALAQLLHRSCQEIEFTANMLTEACRSGNLRMVQWVYQHLPTTVRPVDAIDETAKGGFEYILEWLHHNTDLRCTTSAMDMAASIGRLDIVRFLHEHRQEGCTEYAMTNAVCEGHLDVADYLRINRNEGCTPDTLEEAVSGGCTLPTIRWVIRHYPDQMSQDVLLTTVKQSWVAAIEYFHTLSNAPFWPAVMDTAAAYGNLDLVRWLHQNRTEGCTAEAMREAARAGYLSIVKFLHAHGYPTCELSDIDRSPSHVRAWWRSIQSMGSSLEHE
ncbi:hypothetical protein RI367_007966 [Sorochytrium milnesiophthora]